MTIDIYKDFFTTREVSFLTGKNVDTIQKEVRENLYVGWKVCERTQSFLIPRASVLIPAALIEEVEVEKIFLAFIQTDILTDEERERILKQKRQIAEK